MCGVVPHDHRDEAQLWTHLGRSPCWPCWSCWPCWPCWPCLPPVPAFLIPYQSPRSSRHRGGDHQTFERWMMDFHLPKLGDGLSTEKTAATELKLSTALSPRSPRLGDVLAGIVGGGWQTHLRGHENKNLWEPTLGTTGRPGSSKRKSSLFH